MKTENGKTRNIAADIMKAIGIILVIIGHSTSNGRYLIYTFHMPLFFLLSGCFFHNGNKLSVIIRKGFNRLIIPYIVTCLCVCLFHVVSSITKNESVSSTLLLWIKAALVGLPSNSIKTANVAGVQHIGAIWFFEALFWARIEMWAVLKCKKTAFQFFLLIIVVFSFTFISKHLFWIPTNIGPGTAGCVFLWIGYVVREKGILQKHEKRYWFALSIGLIVIISVADRLVGKRLSLATLNFPLFGLDIIGAIAGCYLVFKIAQLVNKRFPRCSSVLSTVGRSSADILCVHLWDLDCLESIIPGGALRLGFRLLFDIGGGMIIGRIRKCREKSVRFKAEGN